MTVANTSIATPPWRLPCGAAGPWAVWGGFALVLLVAPFVWSSGLGLNVLSQIGIAVIACLAYNILLGQGGMLSFGQAVYSGLGAYLAVHTLNRVADGAWSVPVSLVPLVGGLGGLGFAALFGLVTTRRSGTAFAMITLGLGELVWSMSLMVPEFFGGEGGISTNRVVGAPVLGVSFGPQIQLYYLIAAYCFVCTLAMYAFTQTPLGRMLNAVRDNPERVEFIGYSTRHVRYLAFMVSGFFCGIAGGLTALNFEIVTAEVVGAARSGAYLLFVFIGGASFFVGPILGAVLMVLSLVLLSELTQAWLLYLGLAFVLMVMYAPGGLASLVMANVQVARFGRLGRLRNAYLVLAAAALPFLVGAAVLIEMVYHLKMDAMGAAMPVLFGLTLDTHDIAWWAGAALLAVVGAGLFAKARARFQRDWESVQMEIEQARVAGEAA